MVKHVKCLKRHISYKYIVILLRIVKINYKLIKY